MKKFFILSIMTLVGTAAHADLFPSLTHMKSIFIEGGNSYEYTVVGSSQVQTGPVYMVYGNLLDDAFGYVFGVDIDSPLLLTSKSKMGFGEYIPFAADDEACGLIGKMDTPTPKVEMKKVSVKATQKVVTVYNGKFLVGTPEELFKVTGKKVTEIIKKVRCYTN